MTTPAITLTSTITCPDCGGETTQAMPENACVARFACPHCGTLLRPLAGDCCVFCSYGTVPCPPIQAGTDCCTITGAATDGSGA